MRITTTLALLMIILGCKKEPTSWNTQLSIPLLRTSLGLKQFIADTLLTGNSGDTAFLVYETDLVDLRVDSLLQLPNDSITKSFTIAPLTQFTFNPGQVFFTNTDAFEIDGDDAQLSKVVVNEGSLLLKASNMVDADIVIRIQIPKARLNNISFDYEVVIPAGEGSNISLFEDLVSLNGYSLDLTGANGFQNNTISVNFTIKIADYETPTTIFNTDQVVFTVLYDELTLSYAEGYLGSREITFDESIAFSGLETFDNALINLSAARLDLSFENRFGVDIQANISELSAINFDTQTQISLNHPLTNGSINLIRANYLLGDISSFPKNFAITNQNSNLLDLLNIVPDSIILSGSAIINPLGNISNSNDWAAASSSISGHISVKIPLELGISNLVLVDTVSFEWTDTDENIRALKLFIAAENSFPANATISGKILDIDRQVLLNLDDLLEGSDDAVVIGSDGNVLGETLITYNLGEQEIAMLRNAGFIAFRIRLDSQNFPEIVSFQIHDKIDLLLSAKILTHLEIE